MTGPNEQPSPPPGAAAHGHGRLWAASAAVAGFGSWMLFDAEPGINWFLWTGAAVAGLLGIARPGSSRGPVLLLGGAAVVIAGGAAVTSSPLLALICLSVMLSLAMAMLLSAGLSAEAITTRFTAMAPFVALKNAVVQALRQSLEATQRIHSTRARAWVRGLAVTLPVLVIFGLLLAETDPTFARWRDAIGALLANWEWVPRLVFFVILLVVVLGAYGYASLERGSAPAAEASAPPPARWLGPTERLILLAGVAGLFWLFLAVQVGYLFGNVPQTPGSGMTFAEYARRGFGELSVVATASALLIVASERYGNADGRERTLRLLTLTVIAAVLLLLVSAFRRVALYEAAYGFTTARLYAQVYMIGVALGLGVLSLEVAGEFDAGRLFRRAAVVAGALFIGLIYWNHEGWIAGQNIDRFATTGKLDVAYLARELSPDALPAIAERLPSLPDSVRTELQDAVWKRYARRSQWLERDWFEWNLAASRGRQALTASFESP